MRTIIIMLFLPFLLIGCHIDSPTADNPANHEPQREYTKTIQREASSAFEYQLINQAEGVYPPRDSLLAAAPDWMHARIPDSTGWFYDIWEGIYLPYAITEHAIAYYSHVIDSLAAHPPDNRLLTAEFVYRATIGFHEVYAFDGSDPSTGETVASPASYDSVYVLSMSLEWDQYCGGECGMHFIHHRLVIFDQTGTVLRLIFDAPVVIAVA